MMVFFASFNTPDLAFMPKLEDVFGLYSKMPIGYGSGLPDAGGGLLPGEDEAGDGALPRLQLQALRRAHHLVAAAVITPSGDMMTQAIFAAPMLGLPLSIVIAWVVGTQEGLQSRRVETETT